MTQIQNNHALNDVDEFINCIDVNNGQLIVA